MKNAKNHKELHHMKDSIDHFHEYHKISENMDTSLTGKNQPNRNI